MKVVKTVNGITITAEQEEIIPLQYIDTTISAEKKMEIHLMKMIDEEFSR